MEREAREARRAAEVHAREKAKAERVVSAKALRTATEKLAAQEATLAAHTAALAQHEKALRGVETYLVRTSKKTKRRGGGGGGLLPLLLIVGGGYLLARRPEVRQRVLDTVRGVNPEAADALHRAGRQVRNIVGEVWLERAGEETNPTRKTASYGATSTQGTTSQNAIREADRPTDEVKKDAGRAG